MSTSSLADLVRIAGELSLAGQSRLEHLQRALDTARGQRERLRRYAQDYRADCTAGDASTSAVDLRRRHVMIGRLDEQGTALSTTIERHVRELAAARDEQRRRRASESALRTLQARSAERERAAGHKRELDGIEAACALRAAAERGAAARTPESGRGTRA